MNLRKIKYQDHNYKPLSLALIEEAQEIIEEYSYDSLILTLRQIYYQFVARDLLPDDWADKDTGSTNNMKSYKRLGKLLSNARMSGDLPWTGMEDRTRKSQQLGSWNSPADILDTVVHAFRTPKWNDQSSQPEIWVEKEALAAVIQRVAEEWEIPWMATKGYMSKDAMWRASQRIIKRSQNLDQSTTIIYLGDHDPSGLDMVRDIREQLGVFCDQPGVYLTVNPIALTMDQINEQNPPPNPAKITDTRAKGYIEQYGTESWELDALNPSYLMELMRSKLFDIMPAEIWDMKVAKEEEGRDLLSLAADEMREKWESSDG